MAPSLSDALQIWGFQDSFILFSDGSYGFGCELTTLDVACWDEPAIDGLADRICTFLNGLPEGVDLQFVQEIGRGNDSIIKKNLGLRSPNVTETALLLHESRGANLESADAEGRLPKHHLRLFVRRKPARALLERPKLLSKPKLFEEIAEHTLISELRLTEILREELVHSFGSLGIVANPIEERALAELIYEQWNPCRKIALGAYNPDDLRSSLVFTDLALEEGGFSIGEMHHKILSLKFLPDQTFSSMAKALSDLPFESRLFLSIRVPNQPKELEALQTQRRLAFSMARGKKTGVSDIESEAKFQDLEGLISQIVAQGEKIFHVSLNIVLRSKNEGELNEQAGRVLAKFRELSGAEGLEETLASFDVFSELAIPNARASERAKRMKTSNLADFLPIYGPWTGHETPRILLKSSQGGLLSFDPFSKDLSNYNQIITGGSGSGKSFLTNLLLLQMLKEAPKIYIVDIGGSYRKLCDNLSGQYIPFDLNTKITINPFDLPLNESVPSSQKVKFLVGLIELMTKEEDESRIGRLERAQIEEEIQKLYGENSSPRLSQLRERLLHHTDPLIKRFGKILSPWCGDTPFGRIVDAKTTISLQKPLVSFDLKGLESYPDLQAVVLYLITDFVWQEIQRDRSTMKFLVFDECWKLLENDAGSSFIGEVFRTFRKYYASAVAISQNIDDFARSKIAGALMPNTSIKWVLRQKGADQKRLQEVLQLNDNEMAIISSLYQVRGSYSQAFLMAEEKHSLVMIEPTPLEYWIATTDPRDLAVMESLQKEDPSRSPLDLLKTLSAQYPQGVVASKETK